MQIWKYLVCLALALSLVFTSVLSFAVKENVRAKGVYHQVKKGETLFSICRAYKVSLQEIAEINNITNPAQIEENSVIFIPGVDRQVEVPRPAYKHYEVLPRAPVEPPKEVPVKDKPKIATRDLQEPAPAVKSAPRPEIKPVVKPEPRPESKLAAAPEKPVVKAESKPPEQVPAAPAPILARPPSENGIEMDKKRFAWPVKGTVSLKYGIQPNGMKSNGIRILAAENSPVHASAAGSVIYSANIKYYGDTIIIKHDENFSTVYTYLKDRTVKVGDHVKRGEKIALLGKPDSSDGKSYLHFEVRYQSKPRNPLFFLP